MKAVWNGHVIAEADKEDLIYIEQNWYFPPSALKVTVESRRAHADGVQGAGEGRTDMSRNHSLGKAKQTASVTTQPYKRYGEGALEPATQQSAASAGRAGGFADGQGSTVRLRESDTPYTCPWKGACQYFDVGQGDNWSKDNAWSYPSPKPSAIDTVKKTSVIMWPFGATSR